MIAEIYLRGSTDKIIEKNPQKAVEFYKKAFAAGKTDAAVALGELYYMGEGCEKNILEAANYFAKAADEGDASAAHNAAICYQNYAIECADRKGLKNPVDRKLDGTYMRNMIKSIAYDKKAEELGYKKD